ASLLRVARRWHVLLAVPGGQRRSGMPASVSKGGRAVAGEAAYFSGGPEISGEATRPGPRGISGGTGSGPADDPSELRQSAAIIGRSSRAWVRAGSVRRAGVRLGVAAGPLRRCSSNVSTWRFSGQECSRAARSRWIGGIAGGLGIRG